MSDNDTRFQESYLYRQYFRLLLPIIFALLAGGCTSITPAPQDQTIQEETKDAPRKLIEKKREPQSLPIQKKGTPTTVTTPGAAPSPKAPNTMAKGQRLYEEHCARCHGVNGDGKGEVASDLSSKPRNFTKGIYKFRSTPSGELPTDDDLVRTLSEGIPGTAMEGYPELRKPDLLALVTYLKTFSPRFLKTGPGTPIIVPSPHPMTPEATARGQQVYREMYCAACHGETARGDGELAQGLTDTNGDPIQPADLTTGNFKSGQGPQAIYRTIMTGLDGTPMPSYGDSLDPEKGWDIALYIFSLSQTKETP